MFKFDFKKIFIFNIFLILFSTLFLNIYIDKERFLIKYPDDNFHYLTKASILKDCKDTKINNCLGIKRLYDLNKKNFLIKKYTMDGMILIIDDFVFLN